MDEQSEGNREWKKMTLSVQEEKPYNIKDDPITL